MTRRIVPLLFGLALAFVTTMTGPVLAASGSESKTVGNVTAYIGVLPAEMVRGHPQDHAESTMHGGPPGWADQYHVIIALFDARSGVRISNARVTARVSEIGLAGEEKTLQPMRIAGTVTYGNYFPMDGSRPFRIMVTIRVPGEPQPIHLEFEHRHQ